MKSRFLFFTIFILAISFPSTISAQYISVLGSQTQLVERGRTDCNEAAKSTVNGLELDGHVTLIGEGSVRIRLFDVNNDLIGQLAVDSTAGDGIARAAIHLEPVPAGQEGQAGEDPLDWYVDPVSFSFGWVEFDLRGFTEEGRVSVDVQEGVASFDTTYAADCNGGSGSGTFSIPFRVFHE